MNDSPSIPAVRPLPSGTKIEYCGMPAVVVSDDGGNRIEVMADDCRQSWYWRFCGTECQVISLPHE